MDRDRPVIVWFRQDLRLTDNMALRHAAESGAPVLPVYILDDVNAGKWKPGAASRWWLHQSLESLARSLSDKLCVLTGPADVELPRLARSTGAHSVTWNRCYEPWRRMRDAKIEAALCKDGIKVKSFNGSLLFEPQRVLKPDGTPYKVFTPFLRNGCLNGQGEPDAPLLDVPISRFWNGGPTTSLKDLDLMPSTPWYDGIATAWQPGETGAHDRLERFLNNGIQGYSDGRDRPDQEHVSRLSPHLHFGEVSPRQVWHAANGMRNLPRADADVEHFQRELAWREFSYYLLYHWPGMPTENLQKKFDGFPWQDDPSLLECWQRGRTGLPIVDAGMRELWQTGYMHNRVRMIVASFLVKNLMLDWRHGAAWFWDTLVDADLANNSASWQWVAGSGADAAPYFRIFNPVLQGQRFDPEGIYVRRYVPEVEALPDKLVHRPWEADVRLDYPKPIVDLNATRRRALDAFASIKVAASA